MGLRGFVASTLVLAIVVGALLTPRLAWQLQPVQELVVVVVDKTVPRADPREHKAFMWLLNHHRIAQAGSGRPFDARRDYVGYHPDRPAGRRVRPLQLEPGTVDVLYLADTEGVYAGDRAEQLEQAGQRHRRTPPAAASPRRAPALPKQGPGGAPPARAPRLLHGGLTSDEVQQLDAGMRDGGLLLAEYNTLAPPTQAQARERLERMLGVRWTGWVGRWYGDLGVDAGVPRDVVARWEAAGRRRSWRFSGAGYVLVHRDGRVLVLQEGVHLRAPGLELRSDPHQQRALGLPAAVAYDHWFDVVEAREAAKVLARYELAVRGDGADLLERNGLPASFPAVVQAGGRYRTVYLAGDFGDHVRLPGSHARRWLPAWKRRITPPQRGSREHFLWQVYAPLVSSLLRQREPARTATVATTS